MKNQFKKSISLIMAVLMVLSCWVWIAPTKAEAAGGSYNVTVHVDVTNKADQSQSSGRAVITYVTNNGYGEKKTEYYENRSIFTSEGQKDNWVIAVPGFPVSVSLEVRGRQSALAWEADVTEATLNGVSINGVRVWGGGTDMYSSSAGGMTADNNWHGNTAASQNDELPNTKWDSPYPKTVTGFGKTINMTIPDIYTPENTEVSSKESYSAKVYDQYGTEWVQSPQYFLSQVSNGSPEQDLSDKGSGFWLEKDSTGAVKVKLNSVMQTVFSQKSGHTKDFYLIAYSEGNDRFASAANTITVTYPRYDWKFDARINHASDDLTIMVEATDANGQVITRPYGNTDDERLEADTDKGTFYRQEYLAYNQKSDVSPVSAERPGFEFLGFWTAEQPTEGNSSAYAAEKDFVYPVSTEEYKALSADEKNDYFDAGSKWNPKGETAMTKGHKEYYAWFLSGDVTIKFYDIDGKYLNTAYAKAGYDNSEIKWEIPKNDYRTEGDSYDSGYIKYSNWTGKWKSTKGEIVDPENYVFSEDLMLIPEFATVELSKDYKVNVYSPEGIWDTYTSSTYKYRDIVAIEDVKADTKLTSGTEILTALKNTEKNDNYTYSFVGWSKDAPTTGKNYHFMEEDTNVDENSSVVTLAEDFVVRDDCSFYPVFRRVAKEYDVTFSFKNEAGNDIEKTVTFKYGKVLEIPEEVISVYAKNAKEYTLVGWYRGSDFIDNEAFKSEKCNGTAVYYAEFESKEIKEYKVTFEYRDSYGKLEYFNTTVPVNGKISADDLNKVLADVAVVYDDGTKEAYFKGNWNFEGAADNYSSESLLNLSIKNHITIKAVYEGGIPFRTVKYVDGSNTQSYRILEGKPIQPWTVTVDGVETDYIPVKAADEHGVYAFAGWFDEEQSSVDFSATNGNKYEVGEDVMIAADLTLYPQFTYDKYNYNYKFYDADGKTEIHTAVLHYGDSFAATATAAEAAGNAAAEAKTAADTTYEYMFVGWDKKLPDFCEGGEADSTVEFVAQFKKYYKYYTVEWFGGYVNGQYVNYNEHGTIAEGTAPFATGKYIYDAKIFTPYESFFAPAAEGDMITNKQTYAFSKWCYIDENGDVKDFTRDLRIKGNMKIFATYTPTDTIRRVTVVVDEKTTYTVDVKDGATLTGLVAEPIAGYKNETTHNAFAGWYTKNADGEKVTFYVDPVEGIEATVVNSDITIYADFIDGSHVYDQKEITVDPSFPVNEVTEPVYDEDGNVTGTKVVVSASDGTGRYIIWCECNKEKTTVTKDENGNEFIVPALTDGIAPEGTAYIGSKWKGSNGEDAEAVLVSPSTSLIITTTDKAEANQTPVGFDAELYKYNTAGQGIGVETITLTIKDENGAVVVDNDVVYSWAEIQKSLAKYYESWDKVPEIYKHYNANATKKLGTLGLENGETYVATYVITDISDNEKTISTAPFTYDDLEPVITVADKNTLDGEKFCGKVEFSVTDTNAVTVTAGEYTLRPLQGVYAIEEAGYYNVVAVDEAGNKSSTYVQVIKSDDETIHTFKPYRVDATCEAAGYETRRCEICGFEDAKTPIAQLNHDWKETEIKATCDEDGELSRKCMLCGEYELIAHGYTTTDAATGNLYPADKYNAEYHRTGHAYGEGVVVKAPNCTNTGVSKKICANCGDAIIEELPVVEGAHSFYTPKTIKPTCTTDGEKTQKCRFCNEVVVIAHGYASTNIATGKKYTKETYDPAYSRTGHTESEDYKVIKAPGCEQGYSFVDENDEMAVVPAAYGIKAKYCTACGIILEDTKTSEGEDMKPHNNHEIYLAEFVEPDIGTKGKYTYKCENCSFVKVVELDALEQFTVIFKDENGNTIDKITKYKGESITIADPTKADSKDGKYRYVFDGWYTGKELPKESLSLDSAAVEYTDTKYELPLTASADLTLYAKFTPKEKLYTLKFMSATGYTEDEDGFTFTYSDDKSSELQGVIGDKRSPSFNPKLDGDHKYTFTFREWNSKQDGTGEKLTAIKMDKLSADRTYYAQFDKHEVGYTVVFMEDAKNAIYKAPEKVTDAEGNDITPVIPYGGSVSFVATDANGKDRTPVKAYDDEYHYTFNGNWYLDSACTIPADLNNITEDMVVYAGFTSTAHDTTTSVVQHQACEKAEITKYECKYCDFENTAETKPAGKHVEGTPVYNEETGENIYYCTIETCKKEIRREKASYNIKFVNYDGKTIKNLVIEANSEVKYDYEKFGTPARKADAQYTYTFAGWVSESNQSFTQSDKLPNATADAIYTASYTKTTRSYKVTFATADNVAIKTFDVLYGGSASYEYTEAQFGKPEANADGHYSFAGWDKSTENITGDVLVRPVFQLSDHEFDGGKETGANCTTPGGIKYSCDCGYSYMGTETVPATGHNLVLNEEKSSEPDFTTQTNGKKVYECTNPGCDYEEVVEISAKLAEIKVTVKDTAGNPIQNALVQLYNKADGTQKGGDRTGSSGVVIFYVQPGEYTVTVKVDGVGDTSYDVSVDEDGNTTGNQSQVTIDKPAEEEHKCECSCHRDNFWGAFFRFFQKIIKLFTGKASCCADPDSRI